MIERKVIYVVEGKHFNEIESAERYNDIYERITSLLSILKDEKEDGLIIHNKEVIRGIFKSFCYICAEVFDTFKEVFKRMGDEGILFKGGTCEKIIYNHQYEYPAIYDAYYRFSCINFMSGIEYSTPWFAHHTEDYNKINKSCDDI